MTSKELFLCRKQLLELDLTEARKPNPYVQFSVFSNALVFLICLNEDPRMDQLLKIRKNGLMVNHSLASNLATDLLLLRSLGRLFSYRKFNSS